MLKTVEMPTSVEMLTLQQAMVNAGHCRDADAVEMLTL